MDAGEVVDADVVAVLVLAPSAVHQKQTASAILLAIGRISSDCLSMLHNAALVIEEDSLLIEASSCSMSSMAAGFGYVLALRFLLFGGSGPATTYNESSDR